MKMLQILLYLAPKINNNKNNKVVGKETVLLATERSRMDIGSKSVWVSWWEEDYKKPPVFPFNEPDRGQRPF